LRRLSDITSDSWMLPASGSMYEHKSMVPRVAHTGPRKPPRVSFAIRPL
jgi:hypothetical protein